MIIPTILGYIILRLSKKGLRFKFIQTNLNTGELKEIINGVAAKLEWSMVDSDDRFYMAITNPPFLSGSYDEQITILFDGNRVLVNSIGNPKRRSGLNFMGRNEMNENTLIEAIKAHKQQ